MKYGKEDRIFFLQFYLIEKTFINFLKEKHLKKNNKTTNKKKLLLVATRCSGKIKINTEQDLH